MLPGRISMRGLAGAGGRTSRRRRGHGGKARRGHEEERNPSVPRPGQVSATDAGQDHCGKRALGGSDDGRVRCDPPAGFPPSFHRSSYRSLPGSLGLALKYYYTIVETDTIGGFREI